ncbi:hypothetical protein DPMN_128800 [Dreissena polymorpha]|uniref:Uncharacterized protein n=1 Tax=Dreissena polymorpha TaxID=45954 RepID=A0A9D4H3S6_DREPO|nr:hypothetical protein DPMN_128800 [Dreissena polymorpha]
MIGANTMMPGICSPHIDPRVLVHWNQPSTGNQLQSPVPAASAKSDEDEDESGMTFYVFCFKMIFSI